MEVLNNTKLFTKVDVHSILRDFEIRNKDCEAYLVDLNGKAF
jgi:hypothetical protein